MIVKSTYYLPSNENITRLVDYLVSISGKELSINFVRQNIFKVKSIKNYKDVGRCNLKAAVIYLNYLLSHLDQTNLEENVQTTIAEIVPLIREFDHSEDCSFIITSSNSLTSNFHYKEAQWLFYKNTLPDDARDRYHLDILVLYALRLSLEKRILGILGIESITLSGKPVGLYKLLDITSLLRSIDFNPDVKWDEIIKVNDFLNFFIHRQRRPSPWIIHQIFEVLNPLIKAGKFKDNDKMYGSAYSSTVAQNSNELQKEIEHSISLNFPGANIKWSHGRDVLIINMNDRMDKI